MKFVMGFVAITSMVYYGSMATDKATAEIKKSTNYKDTIVGQEKTISLEFNELWPDMRNDEDVILLEEVLAEIEKGRGKSHKYKKISKTLYPLFMGVLIAKVVLIPLILKMLTAISTAALVMSKISLITTGLLALKWIFSGNGEQATQFELVYVPPPQAHGSIPYRSFKTWNDQSSDDSNKIVDSKETNKQKYIPINKVENKTPYYGGGYGYGVNGDATASNDLYRYNQHQYNNYGKPFL
ncbi:protein Osi13 [Musca autumnalis]|uniref:protein Osi13 n=1 Tax=Musca autumnalis TaxID=221902 RepID=UPI003CE99315